MSEKPTYYVCDLDREDRIALEFRELLAILTMPRGGADYSVWLDKPDAIDLGKRLLKHFDVLPGKEEVDFIETALLLRKLAMNSEREVEQCTATIAKLRRLVGEEGE